MDWRISILIMIILACLLSKLQRYLDKKWRD